jgi:hypothetical protein
MTRTPLSRILALLAILAPLPASAEPEALLGLGWSGIESDYDAASAVVEARTGALVAAYGIELRLGAAGEIDTDADVWGGAGLVVTIPFLDGFRLEASFMPGLYADGSGRDLGGPVQFRSLIGLSYAIAPGYRVGIAVNHKSNANIYDENPGEDSAFAFLAMTF